MLITLFYKIMITIIRSPFNDNLNIQSSKIAYLKPILNSYTFHIICIYI